MLEVNLEARKAVDHRMRYGDGFAADQRTYAAREEVSGQRRDERRYVQVMDRRALQRAQTHAHHERSQHTDDGMNAQHGAAVGDEHAGQTRDRSDGQIDAAGDQHHRHTHGGYAVIGVIHEHINERAQRCKAHAAEHDRAEDIDDQKDADGGVHHDVLGIEQPADQGLAGRNFTIRHIMRPLSPLCGSFHASLRALPSSCAPVRIAVR